MPSPCSLQLGPRRACPAAAAGLSARQRLPRVRQLPRVVAQAAPALAEAAPQARATSYNEEMAKKMGWTDPYTYYPDQASAGAKGGGGGWSRRVSGLLLPGSICPAPCSPVPGLCSSGRVRAGLASWVPRSVACRLAWPPHPRPGAHCPCWGDPGGPGRPVKGGEARTGVPGVWGRAPGGMGELHAPGRPADRPPARPARPRPQGLYWHAIMPNLLVGSQPQCAQDIDKLKEEVGGTGAGL